jgi:beta-glucanase (GH16 family)
MENGQLILTSERDAENPEKYFTGAVTTRGLKNWKDDKPYRMCISAKLPGAKGASKGVWPAHWMLPDNGLSEKCLDEGEVDIMEMINGDGGAYSTYHYMTSFPNLTCGDFNKYHKSRNTLTHIQDWDNNFHEYAIERSKDHINYAIDGRVVHHLPVSQIKTPLSHSPFFLILNTAVGGSWPGEPTPETKLPAEHAIDYVRVSRRSEDAPPVSMGGPLGQSADDIGDLAKSASWADAWHPTPTSFLEEGASFGPPPPMSRK